MAKKTQRICITKIGWFMLFKKILVDAENHAKHVNVLCG